MIKPCSGMLVYTVIPEKATDWLVMFLPEPKIEVKFFEPLGMFGIHGLNLFAEA